MRCPIKFKDLSDYADGCCNTKQAQTVHAHLKECEKCRQDLSGIRLLKQSLSELTPVRESDDFDFTFNQKLKKTVHEDIAVPVSSIIEVFLPKIPVLARVAALFVFTIGALLGSYKYYIYSGLPYVENFDGDVQIYSTAADKLISAKPGMRLRKADAIHTAGNGVVNIVSSGKYAARIKSNSSIVIAQLDTRKFNQHTEFKINSGIIMINTRGGFKGSTMQLDTPAYIAKVVGTAFIINVDKTTAGAWLGVLEGKVRVSSQGEDIYVGGGQKTFALSGQIPQMPKVLSDNEWVLIQELYQLGEKPQVALLISARPDRVRELLKPAPLYIADSYPRTIPEDLESIIKIINNAIKNNDIATHNFAIKKIEDMIKQRPSAKYNPQFTMFIGAYYYYVGNYEKSLEAFTRVTIKYPNYSLASLAQCARAVIYNENLGNKEKATMEFKALAGQYPSSPDAELAREFLKK